jgi:hypothetical protein
MMKTTILTLAAVGALSAGAAVAQPYGQAYGYYGHRWDNVSASIDQRQDMLQNQIERGVETGQLTRREAWQARNTMRDIQRVEYSYRSDGRLSPWEARDLDRRLDALAMQVRIDRRDDERRYGYNEYRPY